ncbi:MAG: hypothetical protein Q7S53_04935 [bacterium]|nr:hypothetical protein [bacterium]
MTEIGNFNTEDGSSSIESPSEQQIGKKPYKDVSEIEKFQRFGDISDLYKSSDFKNFVNNLDKLPIQGKTSSEANLIGRQAQEGQNLIRASLYYYDEVKKRQAGMKNEEAKALETLNSRVPLKSIFSSYENKQLNISALRDCFEWSLTEYDSLGRREGRVATGEEKIAGAADDLEAILQQVNQFR